MSTYHAISGRGISQLGSSQRTLLTLLGKNRALLQPVMARCRQALLSAKGHFKLLNPETGNQELIKRVAAELANRNGGDWSY